MSWSYIPRWKFTDSCGRPRVPGGIHVGCTHDGHMQHGHATRRELLTSCCTMGPARIYPWRRMHRSRAPSIAPGTFFVAQSWAGCITNMPGFNLRQAQQAPDRVREKLVIVHEPASGSRAVSNSPRSDHLLQLAISSSGS